MNDTRGDPDPKLPPRFQPGDEVESRADAMRRGIIRSVGVHHGGQQYYKVFWGGAIGTRIVSESDLAPVRESPSTCELLSSPLGGYPDFQRLVILQKLVRDQPLRNNIYAFNASRTRFFPYQFKPLLKFLDSDRHRLLICDEVGLGKTIEAGLILLELRARQSMRHVLVVCPSNLRPKWRYELRQRFGEDFRVLDSAALSDFFDEYEEAPDRVPPLNGIVSIETLRSRRTRARLEEIEVPFDLVIVDEAHHLRGFSTAQRAVGVALSRSAAAMLMLTATPIHLGQENLFSLLNILDEDDFPELATAEDRFRANEYVVQAQSALNRQPPDFKSASAFLTEAADSPWFRSGSLFPSIRLKVDDLALAGENAPPNKRHRALSELQRDLSEVNLLGRILTRTRKRDVHQDVAVRRAQSIQIQLSPAEQQLYDGITELIRREAANFPGERQTLLWRLNTPQRRYASSIQGMVEFYRGEHAPVVGDDPDDLDRIARSAPLSEDASESELQQLLQRLVSHWPTEGADSKYDELRRVLSARPEAGRSPKVIIFATFLHTIRYLSRRLQQDGFGVVALSGDTPIDERPEVVKRFKDVESVQILLSSRVGSEGLDFQFCSTVVNYDLPWNPMEVEQRIGRVDRIGQAAKSIAIINFWTVGTIEERILKRLYDRIGIFERSIGDLESILGDVSAEFRREILHASLHPHEALTAADRILGVIERQRAAIDELESSAARFVGVDSFFEEEIEGIRRGRRYVTGDQLRVFVTEFLRTEAPRSRLRYDSEKKRGSLTPDVKLKDFLRKSGRLSEALNIVGAVGSSLPITFDSQAAYDEPGLEFINVLHPLVAAIAEFYQSRSKPSRAFHVALTTSVLPPGVYYFFVNRLSVAAARPYTLLEALVLDDQLVVVLEGEPAESLLGEMIESGMSSDDALIVDPNRAEAAAAAAERAFLSSQSELVRRERIANDAFVDQRLAALDVFYAKNIRRKQELLARGEAADRQLKYLRMLRGEIARLEAEREEKRDRQETLRVVAAEHVNVASGLLEVQPLEPQARQR